MLFWKFEILEKNAESHFPNSCKEIGFWKCPPLAFQIPAKKKMIEKARPWLFEFLQKKMGLENPVGMIFGEYPKYVSNMRGEHFSGI